MGCAIPIVITTSSTCTILTHHYRHYRHPRYSRPPVIPAILIVIPAKAGIHPYPSTNAASLNYPNLLLNGVTPGRLAD